MAGGRADAASELVAGGLPPGLRPLGHQTGCAGGRLRHDLRTGPRRSENHFRLGLMAILAFVAASRPSAVNLASCKNGGALQRRRDAWFHCFLPTSSSTAAVMAITPVLSVGSGRGANRLEWRDGRA